ncbi:MAG: dephospho-CoA kinase [Gammaproteobacteria bacterium]|nr:dephospho-CoA kinase [Gammaproteobacteria bacterium]MBT8111438.1 dephospho-CoA kinase [Gammaproteobacteria bacterium]NNL46136.1 dephospho-CoA kinase [Woeseiaceae bacterium]
MRIGLTGGIASGKSTVANMFAELGVPIIDTDVIAREVVEPGQPALDEIRAQFGDEVFAADGQLDRNAMRRRIFSDEHARLQLEAILHPRIGEETRRRASTATGPYQVIVVPLLVGSPLAQFVDRVVVVDCDEELQVQRLLARDAETVEQARRILSAQASRQARLAIADDVISNDNALDETRRRVRELDRSYRDLASRV